MTVRTLQSSSSTPDLPDLVVWTITDEGVVDKQLQRLPPLQDLDVQKANDDSDHSHEPSVIIGPLSCSSEAPPSPCSSSSSTATTASSSSSFSSFCSLSSSLSSDVGGGKRSCFSSGHPNNNNNNNGNNLSVSFNNNVLVMDIEHAKWHYSREEVQSSWYHRSELARQRRTSRHLAATMDFYTDEELFDRFGINSQQSMIDKARRIEQSKLLAQLLLDQEGCTWVPFDTCEEQDNDDDSCNSSSSSGAEEEKVKDVSRNGYHHTLDVFDATAASDTIRRIRKRFTALSVESSIMAQHRALCIAQQLHGTTVTSKSREGS